MVHEYHSRVTDASLGLIHGRESGHCAWMETYPLRMNTEHSLHGIVYMET
jgi:hypothetical protein